MSEDAVRRLEAQLLEIRTMVAGLKVPRIAPAAVSMVEAAQMLSCSPRHIGRLVKRGVLRPREIGGPRRIPVSQIHSLLEEPAGPTADAPPTKRGFDPAAFSAKLKKLRKGR